MHRCSFWLALACPLLATALLWGQQSTVPPPTRLQFRPFQVPTQPGTNVPAQAQPRVPPRSVLVPTQPGQPGAARPQLRAEDILKMLVPPRGFPPRQPPNTRPQGGTGRPQFAPGQTYQPGAPIAPAEPPVPTRQQLMRLSTSDLRKVIFRGATHLSERLDGLSTGAGWKRHLDIEGLVRFGSDPIAEPPTGEQLQWLRGLMQRYVRPQREPRYKSIASIWGFRVLYPAIAELGVEPIHRYRRNLSTDVASLSAALDRVSAGAGWKKFLDLETLSQLTASPETFAQLDAKQLETVIARFNRVANTPDYSKIADMAGFRDARAGILMAHALLGRMRAPGRAPLPPDAEAPLTPPEPQPDSTGSANIGSRPGTIASPGNTATLADKPEPSGTSTINPGGAVLRPDLVVANVVYDDVKQTAIVTVANIGAAKADQESLLHVKIVGFADELPPDWTDPRHDERAMAIGDQAARPPQVNRPGAANAKLVARAAIPFVEFPLVDPNTNTKVDPDAMIEVPDPQGRIDPRDPGRVPMKKVRAGDYYAQLNDVEREFNAEGYSLRDDLPIHFRAATLDTALIDSQIAAMKTSQNVQATVRPIPILPHGHGAGGKPDPTRTVTSDPNMGGMDYSEMFNTYRIPKLAPNTWVKILITPPDPRIGFNLQIRLTADINNVVGESRERNNLWVDTRIDEDNPDVVAEIAKDSNVLDSVHEWHQDFGDPDFFAAYMTTTVKTHASFNKARAELSTRAGVTLFNKDFDAFSANIGADTTAHDAGETWFQVRVNGEPIGPNELERIVGMHHEQRFALGPIPMVVQFTATLRAGVGHQLTSESGHARVSLQPFAYVSVSAKGGVDILIAGGGVGVNLDLLAYDGDADLEAIVIRYDATNEQHNSKLQENVLYRHKFTALGGEASVYAYIWVPKPTWTNPFRFKKKQWDWTIVEWDSPIHVPSEDGDADGMIELVANHRDIALYKRE